MILYAAEKGTKVALDAIQALGGFALVHLSKRITPTNEN